MGRRRGVKTLVWRALWARPVPDEVAYRRAGGRRAYNARRQALAGLRRQAVVELLAESGRSLFARDTVRWLAGELGVSTRTIQRDLAAIYGARVERERRRCPLCGGRGIV